MARTLEEVQDTAEIVNRELERLSVPYTRLEIWSYAQMVVILGLFEIFTALTAVLLPFFSGIFTTVLLGGTIAAGGVFDTLGALAQDSWSRFSRGVVGMAAGMFIIANPIFELGFLRLMLGTYFLGTGVSQLAGAGRSRWEMISGATGFVFGVLVFVDRAANNALSAGLMIGINILLGGISVILVGTRMQAAARRRGHAPSR